MAASGGGGGGQGGAIRMGRAFVEASIDDSSIKPALDRVKRAVLSTSKGLAIAGGAVGRVGAGLFGPIFHEFQQTVEHITEIRKAAQQLDTTTEIFSGLGYAAKKAGVDTDGLVTSARRMQVFLSAAAAGSGQAQAALKKLGLSAQDLIDLPLDEQMGAIADGIAALPNPADQAAAAMKIFGRTGVNLLPVLRQGSAGLKEMADEARDFGLTVSSEEAAKAKQWTTALKQLGNAWEGIKLAIGGALLEIAGPAKEYAATIVNVLKTSRQWVSGNGQLILSIAAAGAALIAIGTALGGLAAGIMAAKVVVGGLGTLLAVVFSPAGLGVLAVVGATAALLEFAKAASGTGGVAGVLGDLGNTFAETMNGVKAALQSGDWEAAFDIMVTGLKAIWASLIEAISKSLQTLWAGIKKEASATMADAALVRGKKPEDAAWYDAIVVLAKEFNHDVLGGANQTDLPDALVKENGKTRLSAHDAAINASVQAHDKALADIEQKYQDALANIAKPSAELEDLRRQLQEKSNTAIFAAFMKDLKNPFPAERRQEAASTVAELAGVRGQFGGGGLSASLALGDQAIPKKQLEELMEVNEKLGRIEDKVGGLPVE